jgi:hypothetical protein
MPVRFASASDSVDFLPPPPWLDEDEDDDDDEYEDDDDDEDEDEEELGVALNAAVEKSGRAATGRRWWCA